MSKDRGLAGLAVILLIAVLGNAAVDFSQQGSLNDRARENHALAKQAKRLAVQNRRFLQGRNGLPGVRSRDDSIGAPGPQGIVGPQGKAIQGDRGPFGPVGAQGPLGGTGSGRCPRLVPY